MLILKPTADKLTITTATAVTAIECHATYVDNASGTITTGRLNQSITGAATSDLVASPAASTDRNVKQISIRNTHATSSCVITVKHTDGTTPVTLISLTLLAGYTLNYNDIDGWELIDPAGSRTAGSLGGRLLRTTVLTASGNHTVGADTKFIVIRGVGGGGGGAGCTSVATAASAGGGGGAGGYLEKLVAVTPSATYAFTIGAAGAGNSAAAGGNGGDSTFVVGATTYTAKGGGGAVVATAVNALTVYKGGAGGAVSTNGDLNSAGDPGQNGIIVVVATPVGASGGGGSGPFGAGGDPISAVGNGNAGKGFGAGGGGAMTGASAARTGGAGTAGCWVVDEYS